MMKVKSYNSTTWMKCRQTLETTIIGLLLVTMVACGGGDNSPVDPNVPDHETTALNIEVSPDTLTLSADGSEKGYFNVKFNKTASFYAKAEREWCILQNEAGNGYNNYSVTVTAEKNTDDKNRITRVTFYCGELTKHAYVLQESNGKKTEDKNKYQISVYPASMEFSGVEQQNSIAVEVSPAASITVTSDVHWCSPIDYNFSTPATGFKLPIKVDDNLGEKRTATITITAGTSQISFQVIQRSIAEDKKPLGGTVGEEVDLGLSVYWSSHNVGASTQTESGAFFAWGEIEEKEKYYDDTYIYYNSNYATYTHIGEGISGRKYDAATVYWKDGWRIPTWAEFHELIEKCKWEWVQIDKVNGYKVTGPNGNHIFLPAQGNKVFSMHSGQNEVVKLWSDCLSLTTEEKAYGLSAKSTGIYRYHCSRFYGLPIRPVKYKNK